MDTRADRLHRVGTGKLLTADRRYEVVSRPRTALVNAQQWLMGKRPPDA